MLQYRIIPILPILLIFVACSKNITPVDDPGLHSRSDDVFQTTGQDKQSTSDQDHVQEVVGLAEPGGFNQAIKLHGDIWQRIRLQLSLKRDLSKKALQEKLSWYARNQDYLDRVADRARPYIHYIVETVEKRGLPIELALLPIVESAYNPFAYSPSHASGLWQFIPSTGRLYRLKQNWWYDGRRDILAATDAALNYLEKLHKEFNGNWLHALAAYNTGEGNLARAISKNRKAGKPVDFWSLRLHRETKGYVPALLAVAEIVANPAKYNISLKAINNAPYFAKVDTDGQIDLATVSELSGLSMDEIYILNPAMNRWATDPDGPHHLLVPIDKKQLFEQKLTTLLPEERINWKQHIIARGDTLGGIAIRYSTDIRTLKKINNLKNNNIRAGRTLLIPVAMQQLDNYTLSYDSRKFKGLKKSGDGNQFLYTIKRGDTLWDIGIQYGVGVNDLCNWNGINPNTILRPGKQLVVWKQDRQDKNNFIAVANHNSTQDTQRITYTVEKGDSLWVIARQYGVSVKQLLKWNNLNRKTYLRPGQNLEIYLGKPPTDV